MRITDKYLFFWSDDSCFSQWYPSTFIIDNVEYNCVEQYMMAEKALMFGDKSTFIEIMKTDDPRKQKTLGKKVRNFDDNTWLFNSRSVVYRGNYNKFSQNNFLKEKLLNTGDLKIVEASPHNTIWGIGLSYDSDLCLDENNWRGTNWLGEVLMSVRHDLRTFDKTNGN